VGEEFKLVTERIKIGKTMEDALQETADRLNTPEFSFFCITWRSSAKPAATWPKRCPTWPTCCASARR
jgi:Flp pilus assembly protein TadB